MRAANDSPYIDIEREAGKTRLALHGNWTIENAGPLERNIAALSGELDDRPVEISGAGIERLDTSGALLLKKLTGDANPSLTGPQRELLDFLPPFANYAPRRKKARPPVFAFFYRIGERSFFVLDYVWRIFIFIGRISLCFMGGFLHPRHLRVPSVVHHIQQTGIRALPIVGLLAVLISMVITYQAAVQLRKFGAAIFTVDLTVISLLREMSVLVTAIMVAGRSGSAFAAEIGAMKLRDEVSALRTMGLDPIEVLVLPRVIALVIVLPLLTFLADVIGLAGGGLVSLSFIGISPYQYMARIQEVATFNMFFVGMIKAPVFAFAIAVIGCFQGLNVSGSAGSVGRMTTLAVVQSIFVVIMADALFSVVFSQMGV